MRSKKFKVLALMVLVCGSVLGQTRVPNDGTSPIYYKSRSVGINTTSPSATLHIDGEASTVLIGENYSSTHPSLLFWGGHPTNYAYIQAGGDNGADANIRFSKYKTINSNLSNFQIYATNSFFSGNVGVGTMSPQSKLHIKGSGTSLNILKLENATWSCNQETAIEFWNGSHKGVATSRIVSKMNNCGDGGENLLFQTQSPTSVNPNKTSPTTKLFIKADGNVGIGTTSPDAILHTKGGIAIQNPHLNFDTSGDATERAGIIFGTNHATNNSMFWISPDATYGNRLNIGTGFKYNDAASKFTIVNSGNIGIGTTSPSAKLDVAGNIKAHEIEVTLASIDDMQLNGTLAANNITVTANGQTADFVFEEDYKLRDLSEVESFIKTNKHLPEIPSAAQMEEQGVNLAEMNKLLLQKVEELTLYAIEKDKRIEKIEGERNKEKEEREKLEERLAKLEALLLKEE